MKKEILKLRAENKTYNEIVKIIGCSKSTVSYYCGKDQKAKTQIRNAKYRKSQKAIIRKKLGRFLKIRVRNFKTSCNRNNKTRCNGRFNYETAYKKITENPKCYLTGRSIDLKSSKSYHLDHIEPCSKGGANTLLNMGLTCKDANFAKNDLSLPDFINLCIEICEHNGYTLTKNN